MIQLLNLDLDLLFKWSQLWQLHFNDSKCKVIHMGNSNPNHYYTMNNVPLTTTAEEKDQGVIMDNELKFHKNTAYILFIAAFTCRDEITVPKIVMAVMRFRMWERNLASPL